MERVGFDQEKMIARQGWKVLRFVPVLCVGLLLLKTFRLYKGGAYFWLDDFNNLYWAQRATFAQMVGHVVNPLSDYFRPAGMICYWILLRIFDLDPAPYHWLAWSLHVANTALVYFILKQLTRARSGAAVGAMLFASQAVFADIYWDFGTIFELMAAFFSFAGILVWISERRSWLHVLLASLFLFLAMKSKEMAVVMPLVWIGYDLLVRKNVGRREVAQWILPGALAFLYGLVKASEMRGVVHTHPYYMGINGSTLASGYGIYFNMLFKANLPWQIWGIGLVIFLLLSILLRSRLALFFQLYVLITFLPVIFLVNHRYAFFWYLPFLGVCGIAAILATGVAAGITARNPQWVAEASAYSVFALLCCGTFFLHKEANRSQRSWIRDRANEYRSFVTGLKALPPPPYGETIYFASEPSRFDQTSLLSATEVALHRTDIGARLVSEFPFGARYRLQFNESRLTQVHSRSDEK